MSMKIKGNNNVKYILMNLTLTLFLAINSVMVISK